MTKFKLKYWNIIVAAVIAAALLVLISIPLRQRWSNAYAETGETYLLQKKYASASLEYEKALLLNKGNETALSGRELALAAARDIFQLEELFRQRNISAQIEQFELARAVPKDEVTATKTARDLIVGEEYQLAIAAAKTATQLEPSYRDGWLYLGIANLKTAQYVELPLEIKSQYLEAANQTLEKARSLDPLYQPTLDFLAELDKANNQ